jgi:hypothetical protein
MTWFSELTGIAPESPESVRAGLELSADGLSLTSRVNGARFRCGRLETPSLADLRARAVGDISGGGGALRVGEVVGDVGKLHADPENAGAFFQVASQFNLLEMVGPDVTPERGVGRYESDRTQGPACAIACGAGTVYRNYFVPLSGQIGQSATRQIDCLADLEATLAQDMGRPGARLWDMRNGYALPSAASLGAIRNHLESLNNAGRDALRVRLRIGLQWETQVTANRARHNVTQAYCSAVPVSYSGLNLRDWAPLARLVLEASYEAALLAAVENARVSGNPRVFLTRVGGGAFGNDLGWIHEAAERAFDRVAGVPLDVAFVSYGRQSPELRPLFRTPTTR